MGKFDREGMEVWHIWFDHTKLGNAEPGCSRPDPSLVVLNVLLEGYLGSGKQAGRHPGFAFSSKATGRGPGERCGDERLSNFGGTRCHGMQTIVTHQICSSFEIAHPHPRWRGRLSVWSSGELPSLFYGAPHFKEFTKSAGSRRRALLRWVQIALKPASKTLGLHRDFIRGQGLKYVIADSAFKRMQVDAPGACWLDAAEHHLGLALRTAGAPNSNSFKYGPPTFR